LQRGELKCQTVSALSLQVWFGYGANRSSYLNEGRYNIF
jgi:hypothetical protein